FVDHRGCEKNEHQLSVTSCQSHQLSILTTDNRPLTTVFYRLLNWKRLRAPFWPYFLRSLPRASRRRKPSAFSLGRNSGLNSCSARAMPMRTAPAWPFTPPPSTVQTTLKLAVVSVSTSDDFAIMRWASVTKYTSNGLLLTLNSPLPGRRNTRATLDLRRPVPWY